MGSMNCVCSPLWKVHFRPITWIHQSLRNRRHCHGLCHVIPVIFLSRRDPRQKLCFVRLDAVGSDACIQDEAVRIRHSFLAIQLVLAGNRIILTRLSFHALQQQQQPPYKRASCGDWNPDGPSMTRSPGSCSGMFWRDAPTPELKKADR